MRKWDIFGTIATIGSIIFGIIGTICDMHDVKDRITRK